MLITDERQWRGHRESLSNTDFWDMKLRAQLGRDLRVLYEESMDEPLPERFNELLGRLEEQERTSSSKLDHEID